MAGGSHASAVHARGGSPLRQSAPAGDGFRTPPPPVRAGRTRTCPLLPAATPLRQVELKAIRVDSAQALRDALDDDPLLLCRPTDRRREPILVDALRRACSPELILALLEHGPDPNLCGPDGASPLDALVPPGAPRSPPDAFSMMLSAQASPLVAPWAGREMQLAAMWQLTARTTVTTSEEQRCQYAEMLLSFGADATRKGTDGMSVADRAEEQGQRLLSRHLRGMIHIDALRRTSCSLSALVQDHAAVGPREVDREPALRREIHGSGQSRLELLADVLLTRICDMLAPASI